MDHPQPAWTQNRVAHKRGTHVCRLFRRPLYKREHHETSWTVFYRGVCWFFDEVEKLTNPTRIGLQGDGVPSRSPGSTPLRILHGILRCYHRAKSWKQLKHWLALVYRLRQYLSNNGVSLRLQAAEMRLRRSPLSVSLLFFADEVGKKQQRDNGLWGRSPHAPCGQQGVIERYCRLRSIVHGL
jgi:hypothetical protein